MGKDIFYPDRRVVLHQYESMQSHYEDILYRLSQRMRNELKPLIIQPTIKTRVKDFESYYLKILRRIREAEIQQTELLNPLSYGIMDMLD